MTSIHVMMPRTMWDLVDSDGYCGYAVIRQLMDPASPRFSLSKRTHQTELRQLLQRLLTELPADFPEEARLRTVDAINL